jgi:phosphonate transport system substrate-binding protein
MIRRTLTIAAATGLVLLGACGQREQGGQAGGAGGGSQVVRFSVLPTENSANLRTLWAPFIEDMGRITGLKVEPVFASNYTALVTAMASEQIDAGWFSNASGLEAVRRAGGEVFARSSDPSGVDGYQSVLIVNTTSPLTLDDVLRCDRTLDFGLGDARSTSGTLAPVTYLFAPRNIEPGRCFATVRSANHEANLLSVANGVLDVATNNSTNLKRLSAAKPEVGARVKVIWTSPTIPEDPIVRRADLDPAVKEKLRQFFLTYGTGTGPEAERQREILRTLDFGTFRPADNSHLLPVREMEATERLLAARNSGKRDAVAAAEQELAAVRAEREESDARAGVPPVPAAVSAAAPVNPAP